MLLPIIVIAHFDTGKYDVMEYSSDRQLDSRKQLCDRAADSKD
jgi:hypothetical protein